MPRVTNHPIAVTCTGFAAQTTTSHTVGSIILLIGTSDVGDGHGGASVIQRLVIAAAILIASTASGCVVPEYYTPGGYSSTCRHRLQESSIVWAQAPNVWAQAPEEMMPQPLSSGSH